MFSLRLRAVWLISSQIAITYLSNREAAESIVAKVKAHGSDAVAIQADVQDPEVGKKVIKAVMEALHMRHS